MYTIIIYNEDKKCLDSIAIDERPSVEGNNISFTNGGFGGINEDFIVVEGEHYPNNGDDISEHIPNDIKETLIGDMEKLQSDLAQTQQVLNDMMLGGLM
jgi:hypothetical protein